MIIEQCTISHLDNFAILFNDYRVHFEQPADLIGSKAFIADRLTKNQAVIFLAIDEESKALMGFTLLYPMYSSLKAKSTWTLNDMFIAEKFRKFGVATQLLDRVKRFGEETDAQWITLKTGTDNLQAQALYEKFGFRKDEDCYYYYLQS